MLIRTFGQVEGVTLIVVSLAGFVALVAWLRFVALDAKAGFVSCAALLLRSFPRWFITDGVR